MADNANKALWNRAFMTDPKHVKPITGKQYKGNSPKPYWIVERLTDEFGPCGIGWGFTIVNERMERLSEDDVLHVALVRLWYILGDKTGSLEQLGQTKATYMTSAGKLMVDEDAPKKSVTDALVKCASYLGFAGDIFSGRWDDSKYVEEAAREWKAKTATKSGAGTISPTREAFEALSKDWQQWMRGTLAPQVENVFEQQGPGAAQSVIDMAVEEHSLGPDELAGLWFLLGSKTRSALKMPEVA